MRNIYSRSRTNLKTELKTTVACLLCLLCLSAMFLQSLNTTMSKIYVCYVYIDILILQRGFPRGTPKLFIFMGFPIVNYQCWVPPFVEPPIDRYFP